MYSPFVSSCCRVEYLLQSGFFRLYLSMISLMSNRFETQQSVGVATY